MLMLSGVILGAMWATRKLFGGLLNVFSMVVYRKQTAKTMLGVTRVSS
jgi:hypothetical protein